MLANGAVLPILRQSVIQYGLGALRVSDRKVKLPDREKSGSVIGGGGSKFRKETW